MEKASLENNLKRIDRYFASLTMEEFEDLLERAEIDFLRGHATIDEVMADMTDEERENVQTFTVNQ